MTKIDAVLSASRTNWFVRSSLALIQQPNPGTGAGSTVNRANLSVNFVFYVIIDTYLYPSTFLYQKSPDDWRELQL